MRVAAVAALALWPVVALAAPERIARVTDGDTVVTVGGERIRIIGLDAPELHGARCPRERRLAETARAELRRLAAGGLDLHRKGRDRYGRTLAIARTLAGQDVAALMIGVGLAHPYNGRGRRGGWCQP